MRVYYTPDLQPFDLGHVQVGQQDVVIPAGVTRHALSGGCSGTCTRLLLPYPIHLTTAHLHMHYLGRCFIVARTCTCVVNVISALPAGTRALV